MKIIRLSAAVIGLSMLMSSGAAMATPEQDAAYESCLWEFVGRNMGTIDQAAAFCYTRTYGGETSGGGPPERTPNPGSGEQCYMSCALN